MTIHREGYKIIFFTFLILLAVNASFYFWLNDFSTIRAIILVLTIVFMIAVLQFFRSPKREIAQNHIHVLSPADGKVVAIEEVLEEEYSVNINYTTLKRYIRNAGLRTPLKRVGEYCFEPGHEMQHDTSPHGVLLGGNKVKGHCASLVLGYSRKLFMQYYPCFTRFEAKTFLKASIEFMGGSCRRCIIDNTSVILSAGSGFNAVMSP